MSVARVEQMTVKVLFFSALRDLAGKSEIQIGLPEGASVGDLLDVLRAQIPGLGDWDKRILVAVDHEYAERDKELNDNQEVAIMPPVQGG